MGREGREVVRYPPCVAMVSVRAAGLATAGCPIMSIEASLACQNHRSDGQGDAAGIPIACCP
jgi:hypothetical protein